MINGLAEVMSRIQEIQNLFPSVQAASANGANLSFANALASAMSAPTSSVAGSSVVADASQYLGVPYVLGGNNPATGMDCSGLVQRVFSDLGYQLPRVASDQAQAGASVATLADAQPGDLVAFGTPVHHIGIYLGNGQMINAPHTGTAVRVEQITETPTAIRRIVADPSTAPAPSLGASSNAPTAFGPLFDSATNQYGLPPGLLAAVAKVESGYNPNATSPAGALGLMQLMPSTARGLGVDPLDPNQAIDGAARLLSGDLNRFKTVPLALAAYNAGSSAVAQYGGIPPYSETQNYVGEVMRNLAGAKP
ncbi:MAG TPA: transglycosylase SLT domain-containing protein [Candidatus Nanopelagicaceae bacterium]|nr:transglycosylase SLT domain-containing protein [Candidatus Nanopelagicaceae bacterium]